MISTTCIVCGGFATEWCARLEHRAFASSITPKMEPHCREHGMVRFLDDSKRVDWAARLAVVKSDWYRVLKFCSIEPAFNDSMTDSLAVERYIKELQIALDLAGTVMCLMCTRTDHTTAEHERLAEMSPQPSGGIEAMRKGELKKLRKIAEAARDVVDSTEDVFAELNELLREAGY